MIHNEIKLSRISTSASCRIRVVGVSHVDPGAGHDAIAVTSDELTKCVPEVYKTIVAGGSVTCTFTGTLFDYKDTPAPTLVFPDVLAPYVGRAFKEITPNVKLVVLWIGTAGSFIRFSGPKAWGGLYNWRSDAKALMACDPTKSFLQAGSEVECSFAGEVYPNPEGIPMYDYETLPQEMPQDHMLDLHMDSSEQATTPLADGVTFASIEAFEPKTSQVVRQWYEGELGKKAYYVGPQAVTANNDPDPAVTGKFPHIFTFLDAQAPRSVWLISFGTLFYPFLHPNHVDALLTTLMKTKTSFLFVRASVMSGLAPLSTEITKAVADSGLGLIVDLAPQQEVLKHPSAGVFVQHGGVNSLFETVVFGGVVPVFWPFAVDQPLNAAHMSQIRDCAFELIQVRTGRGAGPPRRGGLVQGTDEAIATELQQVLVDLKGEIGARKRRNLETLRAELREAGAENGDISKAIQDLVELAVAGKQK